MSEEITPTFFSVVEKPVGVLTHRDQAYHTGFTEWLSRSGDNYFPCHRLDRETSGALLCAHSKEKLGQLSALFAQGQISKKYIFVSPNRSQEDSWVIKGEFSSKKADDRFEETHFHFLRSQGNFHLYEALPKTGRTHQIRRHAQMSKVPILGDTLYGGKNFPRLMLHSLSLSWIEEGERIEKIIPPSSLFSDLQLCRDRQKAAWITAYETRKILFPDLVSLPNESIRLCHQDAGGDLRVDKVGEQWCLGWWKDTPPSAIEQDKLLDWMKALEPKSWVFNWRPSKAERAHPELLLQGGEVQDHWVFHENRVKFHGRLDLGHNYGLFLDQREQRAWVKEVASGKSVLNLFSFTCGFSLMAALGGASRVVSVDLQSKYLEWGKENFRLNDLVAEDFEFFAFETLDFLKMAQRKNWKFDLVICDPPSFSRNSKTKKVFKIEKDFGRLIEDCIGVLSPGGSLLFSTNFESWDGEKWRKEMLRLAPRLGLELVQQGSSGWDFDRDSKNAILKSFLFRKLE